MNEFGERLSKKGELLLGVFIGIYGNWLIALVDKLGKNVGYSMIPFVISFVILLWYFQEAFKNEPTFVKSLRLGNILGSIYFLLIAFSLLWSGLGVSEYTFSAVGIALWFILMTVERKASA